MDDSLEIARAHQVDDLPLWRDLAAHALLQDYLDRYAVPEEQFARLIEAYREHAHKLYKRGLNEDIDAILMMDGD